MNSVDNSIERWSSRLSTIFERHNNYKLDQWHRDFYAEKILKCHNEGTYYISKQSVMLFDKSELFFADWCSTLETDMTLLASALPAQDAVYRLLPLGRYFFEIEFILTKRSLRRFVRGQSIDTVIDKYKIAKLQGTIQWMTS